MKEHLDPETLRRFLDGELPADEIRATDRHLSTCFQCREKADEATSLLTLRLVDEALLSAGYDEAFDRAIRGAARTMAGLQEEARTAEDLFSELLREPIPARRLKIREEERFHRFEVSQLFRLRSREAVFSSPALTLEMADLAVEVAGHLDSGRYGWSFVEGARALAWANLGNAFRINSDLWRAEAALRQAWRHHAQAGQDTFTETELLKITASLRGLQGRYSDCLDLSSRAIAIYRDVEDDHLEGTALLQKAVFLGYQGRNQDAIRVTWTALERIDPEEDPHSLLMARHNLMCSLAEDGAPEEASEMLEEDRSLYWELGYPLDQIRLRWLEGKIAREIGQLTEAEAALREVCDFFVDQGIAIDTFLASLELAETYAIHRRRLQAKEVLTEAIPLGDALGLRKEALAARLLYEQAARA